MATAVVESRAAANTVIPLTARAAELDLLRVLAAFAVVVIHVSSMIVLKKYPAGPAVWWEAVALDGICRWCVPIFVMVSGALLIPNGTEGAGRFFQKRLARIGVPLVFWTVFYLAFRKLVDEPTLTPRAMAGTIIRGTPYYHMYFLYMIAGLYLLTPMLRIFWAGARHWMILLTAMVLLLSAVGETKWAWIRGDVEMPSIFSLFWRFIGYYLLGAVVASSGASARMGLAACAVFVLAAVGAVIGFGTRGSPYLFDFLSVTVVAMSVAIFIAGVSLRGEGWLRRIAKRPLFHEMVVCSLGIYLVHPLVLRGAEFTGAFARLSAASWFMPVAVLLVFAASLALTAVLRRVPGVRSVVA
jgi:surface polysaccharide O-acyltransferase-like enzyme